MSKVQCFKIKRGTSYDLEVKKHFLLLPRWKEVFEKVSELLGEEINHLAFSIEDLIINISELTKEENIRIFKKDGQLKNNSKKAKKIANEYRKIIEEVGLSGYMPLSRINFIYGVMRMRGQNLESFRTSENDIYYKADFDLEKSSEGLVEPITEIEYEEKYLEELRKEKEEV